MNNTFDFLNSKKTDDFCRLSKVNENLLKAEFKKNTDYLLSLKLVNGKKLIDSPRSTAFVGLISLMKSFEKIFDIYVLTGHLEYLLTFKFSQDHLGLIYHYSRSRRRFQSRCF